MSQCLATTSQVAAFQPLRQPARSIRRSVAARCQQQDPLLLRVARGEGGRRWRRRCSCVRAARCK